MINNEEALREKCLNLNSYIVQAPAGSGKTELLTQRFLKLLSHSNSPEEILAVTFTNKAASEMKKRIIGYLDGSLKPKIYRTENLVREVITEFQTRNLDLDEVINNLNIMTIDTLNNRIVKSMPLFSKYGFNSHIEMDPNPIYKKTIQETLYDENIAESIHDLLETLKITFSGLESYMLDLLNNREFWIYEILTESQYDSFTSYYQNEKEKAIDQINTLFNLDLKYKEDCKGIVNFINQVYTKQGSVRKKINFDQIEKKYLIALKSLITDNQIPEFSLIEKSIYFININHQEDSDLIKRLKPILISLLARLKINFNGSQKADFSEISQQAIHALSNDSEENNPNDYLSLKFSHLLIDEFQDINSTQLKIFNLVTKSWNKENTIFCVGDPMQSIYRFRKSEVGIFLNTLKTKFCNQTLEHIILSTNNRSKSNLINWFNREFKIIFPNVNDTDEGLVSYQSCSSNADNIGGEVNLLAFTCDNELDSDQAEAELIAQQLINSPYKTKAVIARSRTHLKNVISYIKKYYTNEIKVNAIEIETLFNHQCVQDILILTLSLNNFSNKLYWVGLLNSPLCGITLSDMAILFSDEDEGNIWEIINTNKISQISIDGNKRITFLKEIINYHKKNIYIKNWSELILDVWSDLNGIRTLYQKNDYEYIQQYLNELKVFDSDLIDDDELIRKIELSMVSSIDQSGDAVDFLTIHKSKGLEYDHVIIPSLNKNTRNQTSPLIDFDFNPIENLNTFSIKTSNDKTYTLHGYHTIKNKIRNHNELKRLFYVALTRAKSQLDLVSYKPNNELKPQKNTFLELVWKNFDHINPKNIEPKKIQQNISNFSPKSIRLPVEFFENTKKNYNPDILIKNRKKKNVDVNSDEINIGLVVHKYLELHHLGYINDSTNIKMLFENCLNQLNLNTALNHNLFSEFQLCVNKLYQSKDGQFILQKYQSDFSEYKISNRNTTHTSHFRLDRTFILNNERWLIDYKYHANDKDLTETANYYRTQLNNYANFFDEAVIHKSIYFLKQGKLVTLN